MNTRRLLLLGVFAFAFDGCGGGSSGGTFLDASGGTASAKGIAGASGGGGGALNVHSAGVIKIGVSTGPAAPALPQPPTTGTELTNAMIAAGTPIPGNILVSSTLQILGGPDPATITSSTGDIVILGTLIGERSAGTTTKAISISAPAGTIYVRGTLRTRGTAGSPDNPHGGDITLTAQRIVVTGTIDAGGEDEPGGVGGDGGNLLLDTTGAGGTDVLCRGKLLTTVGGAGAQGGKGGNVTLRSAGQLAVFQEIRADGGAANSTGVNPTGGPGGNVAFQGDGGGSVRAAISLAGGDAEGFADGARGGNGGALTADAAVAWNLFGSIVSRGGSATAQALGAGSIVAGKGGDVNIGGVTRVASLTVGTGLMTTAGGRGPGGGGAGGPMLIESWDGDIVVKSTLSSRGGHATETQSLSAAGAGGAITLTTDGAAAGNSVNHSISVSSRIDARGGDGKSLAVLGQTAGNGGKVSFSCGGDLTCTGTVETSGGDADFGGNAGAIEFLMIAANLPPTGRINVTGDLLAEGGSNGQNVGGHANTITLSAVAGVSVSGNLSARGGTYGGQGLYGDGKSVAVTSVSGPINLMGTVTTRAGDNFTSPSPVSGDLTVATSGSITIGATIDVSGARPHRSNSGLTGSPSGNVWVTSSGPGGTITLLNTTVILADGGGVNHNGGNVPGGAGGKMALTTVDGAVILAGTLSAQGGVSPNGTGGFGGQIVVNSDSNGDGTGGSITIVARCEINVSAGIGFQGGSALNNGGAPPADSSGANLAVVLDAAGGLTSSPDGGNEGVIQNLGRIIATGAGVIGRGGDIWFDGKNALGGNLAIADSGTQDRSGPGGWGAFFPN